MQVLDSTDRKAIAAGAAQPQSAAQPALPSPGAATAAAAAACIGADPDGLRAQSGCQSCRGGCGI